MRQATSCGTLGGSKRGNVKQRYLKLSEKFDAFSTTLTNNLTPASLSLTVYTVILLSDLCLGTLEFVSYLTYVI